MNKKKITILGSTGSIGENTLKIISAHSEKFEVTALSANINYKRLIEQINIYKPKYVCINDKEGFQKITETYPDLTVFYGEDGLKGLGQLDDHDIIVTAVSGAIGLEATVEAIKKEKRIALANKETLVAGGYLIKKLLKQYTKAEIIPVDSEHSAIFQSMRAGNHSEISKIILTASGGPFRGKTLDFLANITVEAALKHPNWSMGKKITIDSSTLVNKGLEVIEAHHLFDISYDDIDVVVHPQSIIHSMVQFKDKSIIAQMGEPDMKIPILYAFSYPERYQNDLLQDFDFGKYHSITFEKPDLTTFRGLALAYEAGKQGDSMPIVYNAANEVAVDLFLSYKIPYLTIYDIIEEAMKNHKTIQVDTDIQMIKMIDKEIRGKIYQKYNR